MIVTLTLKEKEIKPTKLNQLESGDTFTFKSESEPHIVLDEQNDDGLFQVVSLKTGAIYRYTGDDVVLRNYVLEEVS